MGILIIEVFRLSFSLCNFATITISLQVSSSPFFHFVYYYRRPPFQVKAMDSGNSSSMQSSSGGDEEYESRPESIPAFLNPSGHFGSVSSNPQPPPFSHHQNHPPTLFDPRSNYVDAFSQSSANPNANSLLNLDTVWSRGLRSEPNCTDFGNLTGLSSSSTSSSGQSMLGVQGPGQGQFPSSSSTRMMSVHENGGRASSASLPSDQTNVVRSSKKRTRASRRAPTTVLTTDTSNFRAMVQEFTGIPAPPFSASPYSRRLDLFGAGSSIKPGHLEPLGPLYPLRPSPHKVQPNPFVSSSSSPSPSFFNSTIGDSIVSTTNIATTSTNNIITTSMAAPTNAINSGSNTYQLPSDPGFPKQPQNVLGMQNPILSFQSLLQSPPSHPLKYPLADVPVFGTKSPASLTLPLPSFEELGVPHGHVNANISGLPSHATSGGSRRLRTDDNGTCWRDGAGSNEGSREQLRPFNGNYGDSPQVSSFKLNCSASSSAFHPEKGSDNVSSRGEGTVDSWICPSD